MIDKFIIEVTSRSGKYLVEVKEQVSYDQREGPGYDTLAVALGYNKHETIREAVQEAFV